MNIISEQHTDVELLAAEARIKAMGFSLASVQSDKELRPMQYMKRRHGSSPTQFTDQYIWTVTRRRS